MHKIKYLIFTYLLCQSIYALPKDENTTLHLTLTNQTPHTLYFIRVEKSNAGNQFDIQPTTIRPAQTTTIIAEKTLQNDIFAQLLFIDEESHETRLTILDQEQVHFGQPIFKFNGEAYTSELISKTRNPNIGPRFLTYIAADLNVTPIPAILRAL